MTTTQPAVTVNRATEFANWLLTLIGGQSRLNAMNVCIECLLKGHCVDKEKKSFADFITECKEKGKNFCHKNGWHEENQAFVGFNLLLQEKFYLLWIPVDIIDDLKPYEDEKDLGLLRIPECSADDLIAMVEEVVGEKAELEEELGKVMDKVRHGRWDRRTRKALQKACNEYVTPSANLLDEFEKLIRIWRGKLAQ